VSNKGSLWRSVRAVAWSFIGIRKSSGFQEDVANIKPLHVLGVGVVAALLFVIGLIVLVNLVVAK
jgi:amino acid transporter